jgi:hypothetical protein
VDTTTGCTTNRTPTTSCLLEGVFAEGRFVGRMIGVLAVDLDRRLQAYRPQPIA